jgi:hypothetical protein
MRQTEQLKRQLDSFIILKHFYLLDLLRPRWRMHSDALDANKTFVGIKDDQRKSYGTVQAGISDAAACSV